MTTERAKSVDDAIERGALLIEERRPAERGAAALASSYSSLNVSAGFSHSIFCCLHVGERHVHRHGEAVARRELRVGEADRRTR